MAGPALAQTPAIPGVVMSQPVADPVVQDQKFAAFLVSFRPTALAAGIRPETYDRAMANLRRDPDVEAANLAQPEFLKPVWSYLDTAVSPARISKGQQMLATYATQLAASENKYGVPKEILVAIWGLESNYGAQMGNYEIFDALATLAYDGPRADFGKRELIAAMKMEEKEGYAPSNMTSSWAGAFGNTQFIPSAFLAYAVDGDGDGKIDLWNSPPDALASTASHLSSQGWVPGQVWGYEVTLPANFDYAQAELDQKKALSEWRMLGVTKASGAALTGGDTQATILTPGGAHGPAFLVLENFRNVMKYNNSINYALGICLLSDQLAGKSGVTASWPRSEVTLTHDQRIQFQTDLKVLGYDPGAIDGVLGRGVRAALRQYQKAKGLPADGFATQSILNRLDADVKAKNG
jgi:membrane-bound lytic murein transglycosylase B